MPTKTDVEGILVLVLLAVVPPLALFVLAKMGRLRDLPGRPPKRAPAALFQAIEALMRERPFTQHAVWRITKKPLPGRDADKYFDTYISDRGRKAILQSVELRMPTPESSKMDGMVILTVNPRARITPLAVTKRFGSNPDFVPPHPCAPIGCYYRYKHPWGTLSFGFARGTEYLETVVIDAIDAPPA
jgi:hypothetical protein